MPWSLPYSRRPRRRTASSMLRLRMRSSPSSAKRSLIMRTYITICCPPFVSRCAAATRMRRSTMRCGSSRAGAIPCWCFAASSRIRRRTSVWRIRRRLSSRRRRSPPFRTWAIPRGSSRSPRRSSMSARRRRVIPSRTRCSPQKKMRAKTGTTMCRPISAILPSAAAR